MLVRALLLPFGYSIKLLLTLTLLLDCFSPDMVRQYSVLEEKHSQSQAELVRRCSDLEEKYSQSQTKLAQVSGSLNDANMLNSTLRAQLDSEKVTCESGLCFSMLLLLA
jgi:TolA-binding protein